MDEEQGPARAKLSGSEQEAARVQVTQDSAAADAPTNDATKQDRTLEQVRAEIEETREQLGETVEALAAKTDVKGQAKRAVGDAKTTVADTVTSARQTVSEKKDDVVSAAQQAAPESAGDASQRVLTLVRENRSTVIPAAALVFGVLIGRRRSR
jgi:Protein of unknown function (DUF3618)